MLGNPYEAPDSTPNGAMVKPSAFPFFSVGPATGAAVGVTHIASMVGVWAINGYPDAFFRTPDWAWIAAILMAIGGAVFGLLYGVVLRLTANMMSRSIRPKLHFYSAVILSLTITAVLCELSLRNIASVDPLLTCLGIAACSFCVALVTAARVEHQT